MKKIRTFLFFLLFCIIFIIVPLGIVWRKLYCLLPEINEKEEIIIETLIGSISFLGTTILGAIAYWQTKKANQISALIAKKQMFTYIEWDEKVKFSLEKDINTKRALKFSKKNEMEGALCSVKKQKIICAENRKSTYLRIDFSFTAKEAPLKKVYLYQCSFNKNFENDKKDKKYFLPFYIFNKGKIVPCPFNPQENKYSFILYLNCKFNTLNKINEAGYFVLNLKIGLKSYYNITQNVDMAFNFEQIDNFKKIIDKSKTKQVELKNILIHEGDIKNG